MKNNQSSASRIARSALGKASASVFLSFFLSLLGKQAPARRGKHTGSLVSCSVSTIESLKSINFVHHFQIKIFIGKV